MKISKEAYEKNKEYNKTTYDQINLTVNKQFHLNELLKAGCNKYDMTKQKYILMAIVNQLKADGIEVPEIEIRKWNLRK